VLAHALSPTISQGRRSPAARLVARGGKRLPYLGGVRSLLEGALPGVRRWERGRPAASPAPRMPAHQRCATRGGGRRGSPALQMLREPSQRRTDRRDRVTFSQPRHAPTVGIETSTPRRPTRRRSSAGWQSAGACSYCGRVGKSTPPLGCRSSESRSPLPSLSLGFPARAFTRLRSVSEPTVETSCPTSPANATRFRRSSWGFVGARPAPGICRERCHV
jgi:hypothetical protein